MSTEAPFKIGEEVVCVDFQFNGIRSNHEIYPKKGDRYHVRDIFWHQSGIWAVRLEEIVNGVFEYKNGRTELSFKASCFRRLEFYPDATAEILEKFKPFEGVEVDQPIKIKELEIQN